MTVHRSIATQTPRLSPQELAAMRERLLLSFELSSFFNELRTGLSAALRQQDLHEDRQ